MLVQAIKHKVKHFSLKPRLKLQVDWIFGHQSGVFFELLLVEFVHVVKNLVRKNEIWLLFIDFNHPHVDVLNLLCLLIYCVETQEQSLNGSNHVTKNNNSQHLY